MPRTRLRLAAKQGFYPPGLLFTVLAAPSTGRRGVMVWSDELPADAAACAVSVEMDDVLGGVQVMDDVAEASLRIARTIWRKRVINSTTPVELLECGEDAHLESREDGVVAHEAIAEREPTVLCVEVRARRSVHSVIACR